MLKYNLFESNNKTHVMTFMRANPITIGHEKVVRQVTDLADSLGSDHSVILSHSYDGDKNPLSPEHKLKHAKRAFPWAKVSTSSHERPSLLYHLADLHKKGVENLHLIVGEDRVKGFTDIISKYNGVEGPHGLFKFKSFQVHSAGHRDPDAEGVEGVSGTSQRKHALSGNKEMFHAGAPSHMTPEEKDELMKDVISGTIPKKPKKSKKLKEEFTSSSDVGGLGFNTGNPAINDEELKNYTTNNLADDPQNGSFIKALHNLHTKLHNKIQFSSTFNPDSKIKSFKSFVRSSKK